MIYIKRNIRGYYREYSEPFDTNINNNIGVTYEDFLDNKWVPLSDEQILFHQENPGASIKEVWDMQLNEKTIEKVRYDKLREIDQYDSSDNVNSFTIGGVQMWLTVQERQQIATQISASEAVERDVMTRWFNGHEFSFPIAQWKQMLVALEIYAGDALNTTEMHKANVMNLETIEAIEDYDITEQYPQKLIF